MWKGPIHNKYLSQIANYWLLFFPLCTRLFNFETVYIFLKTNNLACWLTRHMIAPGVILVGIRILSVIA